MQGDNIASRLGAGEVGLILDTTSSPLDVAALAREAHALVAILTASIRTAKAA